MPNRLPIADSRRPAGDGVDCRGEWAFLVDRRTSDGTRDLLELFKFLPCDEKPSKYVAPKPALVHQFLNLVCCDSKLFRRVSLIDDFDAFDESLYGSGRF